MTELSIHEFKWPPNLSQSQQRCQQSIFSTHLCTLLSVMHLQRIIVDNKFAHDFIDTVLLSIYSHVIELVLLSLNTRSYHSDLLTMTTDCTTQRIKEHLLHTR